MKFLQLAILIFVIALCGYVSAQTTVCSGDSVVLVLNGYKQGSTLWQQSSDLNTWSKALGTSYNDSLIIIATNNYYYRAIVTDGTCSPYYSDVVLVKVRPVPPVAKPASGITLFSFDANWNPVAGASTYYIDVATDSMFTSFINGFNNLKVNDKISTVTGIMCNTTYYYRVRAYDDTCNQTSGNSNTIAVTIPSCPEYCTYKSTCNGKIYDFRDQKMYNTVQIGTQCWMAQNLNVGTRIDGIRPQTPGSDNQNTSIEKYCYGDDEGNCNTYGGLYQWREMMAYGLSDSVAPGPRGICPVGWHIPTDSEWTCLEMTIGLPVAKSGGMLRDTSLWSSDSAANNKTGFTALPGGYRYYWAPFGITGSFVNQGVLGAWWSSTEYKVGYPWSRQLRSKTSSVDRGYDCVDWPIEIENHSYPTPGLGGYSVRCTKD